jgi:lipopolysaccharide transport system permease protein
METSISEAQPADLGSPIETIIEAKKGLRWINLRELWRYHELLFFLVWRDVGVRYRQSVLGIGWAVLQPFLTMMVFTIIFGRFARIPSEGIPYPLFSYSALLPWTYFARSLSASSDSLVGSTNLVSKVYFPRLILPLTGVMVGLVDFAVAFLLLIGMMFWYGFSPNWGVVLLPVFIFLSLLTALGTGLWLTSLNVKFRDVKFVVPFFTQIWMYASPIIYPSSLIPEKFRALYGLNPMVGIIEGFRWALIGQAAPDWTMMAVSCLVVLGLLVSGLLYFRNMEKIFADII